MEIIQITCIQQHKSICSYAVTTVAYVGDPQLTLCSLLRIEKAAVFMPDMRITVVGYEEIVSRALIFIQLHHYLLFIKCLRGETQEALFLPLYARES